MSGRGVAAIAVLALTPALGSCGDSKGICEPCTYNGDCESNRCTTLYAVGTNAKTGNRCFPRGAMEGQVVLCPEGTIDEYTEDDDSREDDSEQDDTEDADEE